MRHDDAIVKKGYRAYTLSSFGVLVNEAVLDHPAEAAAVLLRVDEALADAVERFGRPRAERIRGVRIWIEWESSDPRPRGAAEFHQSRVWLAEHGYDVDKEHGIEINNTRLFLRATATQQPYALLHELAHAYDAQVLHNADLAVASAYQAAVASGRYDTVRHIGVADPGPAYALSNPREYFAETTESYLAINDYFPFVREQLEVADTPGFALMTRVWGARKRRELAVEPCAAAASAPAGTPTAIVLRNSGAAPVEVAWLDAAGTRVPMRAVAPSGMDVQITYVGHVFALSNASTGSCLGLVRGTREVGEVLLR